MVIVDLKGCRLIVNCSNDICCVRFGLPEERNDNENQLVKDGPKMGLNTFEAQESGDWVGNLKQARQSLSIIKEATEFMEILERLFVGMKVGDVRKLLRLTKVKYESLSSS
jgi:hypothetical protein